VDDISQQSSDYKHTFPETDSWFVARPGDGGPIIGFIERRLTPPYFEGFDRFYASIGVFETRAAAAIALERDVEAWR
jgi:hypothetical protein